MMNGNEETLYYSNFSILNEEDGPKMAKYFLLKKRLIVLLGRDYSSRILQATVRLLDADLSQDWPIW